MHLSLLIVTTPSVFVSAPVMQPLTQRGSLQWRHETAKLIPPISSIFIRGLIFIPFNALAMSFSLLEAKAQ